MNGKVNMWRGLILLTVLLTVGGHGASLSQAATKASVRNANGQPIALEIHEGRLIKLPRPATTVFIANSGIADVSVKSPRLIYVFGKKTGETTLFAVDERENVIADMRILVSHNISRLNTSLSRLLPSGGVTAISIDGGIVLTGEVASSADADNVKRVIIGKDAAIEQGYADPDRLAIMGQSYGSLNTLAIITQTTRFKAAVITAAGLHPDLFADYLLSIGYYEQGQGNMGGTIWEYHDRYLQNSPLFHFDRIETPLLIGQGERDGDLVASEAIFAALERLGKDVEYRLYEAEGHVITQTPNLLDFWNRRLEFLAKHLGLQVDEKGGIISTRN